MKLNFQISGIQDFCYQLVYFSFMQGTYRRMYEGAWEILRGDVWETYELTDDGEPEKSYQKYINNTSDWVDDEEQQNYQRYMGESNGD